jgi:hypothetical protein
MFISPCVHLLDRVARDDHRGWAIVPAAVATTTLAAATAATVFTPIAATTTTRCATATQLLVP